MSLQSVSKPTELGRRNGIVKLSMYSTMDEPKVISSEVGFFATCLVTDDKRILPALWTQGREGTE